MKFLFVFAHPDDETVGAGGTLVRLAEVGHQTRVVCATAGGAGELKGMYDDSADGRAKVLAVRDAEMREACRILRVGSYRILEHNDGFLRNTSVWISYDNGIWGRLTLDLIDEIEQFAPDFVVTFDHTGWYYHLDHVAVSLAATRAVSQAGHQPLGILFNWFRPVELQQKFSYYYPEPMPITHRVDTADYTAVKKAAMQAHASQNLQLWHRYEQGELLDELYQLYGSDELGAGMLQASGIFESASA